jgi:hypothetical protein
MYVKPSKSSPAAIRKANWEAAQKRKNEQALASVIASVKK